jgi:TolB-like protein/DNA-binding winged helix-turn-helix (wHTH) protein
MKMQTSRFRQTGQTTIVARMDSQSSTPFRIGEWSVDPRSGQLSRGSEGIRVEARTLRLLLCLARNAGEVVSIDDLLTEVWQGVVVSPDSVYQAVTSLRRLLGDDPKRPTYIATVPRRGYRMIATVTSDAHVVAQATVQPPAGESGALNRRAAGGDSALRPSRPAIEGSSLAEAPSAAGRWRVAGVLGVVGAMVIAVAAVSGGVLAYHSMTRDAAAAPSPAPAAAKSVAVLPFLDLTDNMNEEPFADGMTEELINNLSQVPGLKVPAPTSSFYFKGKQLTVKDIAQSLRVAYVLDGSVRKSGTTLRVAARLVRADDNYVVWANTYDRPIADKLMVQDDIAAEVTKALSASIN